jgi:hypothetical protein
VFLDWLFFFDKAYLNVYKRQLLKDYLINLTI